jgi:hypothetical protein
MKLSDIILESLTKQDRVDVSREILKLAKEIGQYAGLDDGMAARGVVAIDGILSSYFLRDYDAAVEKYGDAIESIEVETTKYGPKAAALKINFKPGMEPKGLTAADVKSAGSLD